MLDDVLGLIILAVVTGIAQTGTVSTATIGWLGTKAVLFLAVALIVGVRLAPLLVRGMNRLKARGTLIVYAVVFAVGLAALADLIGLATIIGAFAAGLVLAKTERREHIEQRIKPVADLLVPVFFVTIGMKVQPAMLNPFAANAHFWLALTLTMFAIASKLATGLVVYQRGVRHWPPIVMTGVGDAVGTSLVASLARPGGNVTGLTDSVPELLAKRLEFLKEALPGIRRVAVLVNPANPHLQTGLKALESAARSLKVELQEFEVWKPDEFERAFSAMAKSRVDAIVVVQDSLFNANATVIADLATKKRLPSSGSRISLRLAAPSATAGIYPTTIGGRPILWTESSEVRSLPIFPLSSPPSSSW